MKIFPSFSKRAYVLSGTLLALSAVFVFYYFVYVPEQEEAILKQRERALNQVVKNFQYTYQVYEKNAKTRFDVERNLWETRTKLSLHILNVDTITSNIEILIKSQYTDQTGAFNSEIIKNNFNNVKSKEVLLNSLAAKLDSLIQELKYNPYAQDALQKLTSKKENIKYANNIEKQEPTQLDFLIKELKYNPYAQYALQKLTSKKENIKYVNNIEKQDPTQLDSLIQELKHNPYAQDALQKLSLNKDKIKYANNIEKQDPIQLDSLIKELQYNPYAQDTLQKLSLNKDKINSIKERKLSYLNKIKTSFIDYQPTILEKIKSVKSETLHKKINISRKSSKPINNEVLFFSEPIYRPIEKDTITIQASCKISDLMNSVSKDTTIFQAFVLYRDDSVRPIYQNIQGDLLLKMENQNESGKPIHSVSYKPMDKVESFGDIRDVKLGLGSYILFPTSFTTHDDKRWHLYALVSKTDYERSSRAVPTIIVTTYGGMLLLILFSMPLLKISFMSQIERLHQHNIIQIAVSFVLTFSLVVLGIISMDAYVVDNNSKISKNLEKISYSISDDFEVEIENITTQISYVDNSLGSLGLENQSLNIFTDSAQNKKLINNFKTYPYFNYMFWMDSVGINKYEFTTIDPSTPGLDSEKYDQRPYFKFINTGKGWSGELNDKRLNQYYIQSINSWKNDGLPAAIVSMPSTQKNVKVVALSTQLYSLMDPLLPPGYEYLVIDKYGNVLFNSNKSKNLQQNLLEESGESKGLIATLLSNTSSALDLPYNSKEHQTFIQPLPLTPWHLVVSYDDEYSSVPFSQIILFSLVYIVLLSALLGTLTLAMHWMYLKSSKLARRDFLFEWFRPLEKNLNKYLLILTLNIIIGGILILYNVFVSVSVPSTFASFASALAILYGFSFAILTEDKSPRFLFFIGLIFFILLAILAFLWNLIGFNIAYIVLIEILLCISLILFSLFNDELINPLDWFEKIKAVKINFKNSYLAMLFSFLLINGFLSTFFLFSKIYQEEFIIWQREALYRISNSIEQREDAIRVRYIKYLDKDSNEAATNDLNNKGVFLKQLGYTFENVEKSKYRTNHHISEGNYYQYLTHVRPHLNKLVTSSNGFSSTHSQDGSWISMTDKINENRQTPELLLIHNNKPYKLTQRALSIDVPFYFTGLKNIQFGNIVFFVLLLLLVVVVYYVLEYVIKKLFTWNLFFCSDIFKTDDKDFKKNIEELRQLHQEEAQELVPNNEQNFLRTEKIIPLEIFKTKSNKKLSRDYSSTFNLRELVDYECCVNHELMKFKPTLEHLIEQRYLKFNDDEAIKEEILLKIQRMAQDYYFSLWNSCSKEEKYILHDLAEDGFVNTKNITTIILLIEKNLVHYSDDEQLRIMNESFRNFILTNVQKSEALAMEMERAQQGTYSIIRAVIIVVVLGTLFFISFAEKSILDSFSAILVALAALVPILLRLGGGFGSSSEVKV